MPSRKPRDLAGVLCPPTSAAVVQRFPLNLGAFTANTTVVAGPRIAFDRKAVIREIWVSGSAIPADPDGTMLLNAIVSDVSEEADDTIVSSQDLEALILVAEKAYKCTLATETTENELTMEPGDVLRFSLVNNSAAIGNNATINAMVLVQFVDAIENSPSGL